MSSKKKIVTSAVALGTAAALTLGGTFAWQSISQRALNEKSNIVNPGARLHNDMHYVDENVTDLNVFVENFTEDGEDIYARVRLGEYMELVMNYDTPAEKVEVVTGSKIPKEGVTDVTAEDATEQNKFNYTYVVHDFAKDADSKNPTNAYFHLTPGSADTAADDLPYYMPTFNKNKDSLMADINGMYSLRVGGIGSFDEYFDDGYANYGVGDGQESSATAWALYDKDTNYIDELKEANLDASQLNEIIFNPTDGGTASEYWQESFADSVLLKQETHEAKQVGSTKGLISMAEWHELAAAYMEDGKLTDEGKTEMGGYWVYDTDGWVYWSSPIKSGETTGLLLDGYELTGVMDDTWYYAIDVVGQFVTANDVGKETNTGFYDPNGCPDMVLSTDADDGDDAEVAALSDDESDVTAESTKYVSDEAETLLKLIGVQIGDTTTGDEGEDDENAALTFSLISGPDGAKTATYNGYTMFQDWNHSDNPIEEDVVWKIGASYGQSGDYDYTWSCDSGKFAFKDVEVGEVDDSGIQKLSAYNGQVEIGSLNTKTGELTLDKQYVESYTSEYMLNVTVSKDGSTVNSGKVMLGHSAPIYLYYYADEKEYTNGVDHCTVDPGKTEHLYFNSTDQGLGNGATLLFEQVEGDNCPCLSGEMGSEKWNVTHSEDGTCNHKGATFRLYLEAYPWVYGENTVSCGTSSAGGGQTETVTDWSSKVKLRNITSDEYDLLCDATNESNDLMHWNKIGSITDTVNESLRVVRGYTSARTSRDYSVTNYGGSDGWRAAFESLTPGLDCADLSVGDVVVMGTLYVGGEALKVPTNPVNSYTDATSDMTAYDKDGSGVTSKITLGKALEDTTYQVKAVYVGDGLFVCDRCMLNYISWEQINAALTAE